ncbi:hypothetical protein ACVR1I_09445 [Streptococcus cameli]
MKAEEQQQLLLLIDLYEYGIAYRFAQTIQHCPKDMLDLLYLLKERRELDIRPAQEAGLVMNQEESAEQIANYILDLQVKFKKNQLIDFVRAVSPVLYRIFLRILYMEIPNLKDYIYDSKDQSYDEWIWDALANSSNEVLQTFRSGRNVTSSSLVQLIQLLPYSQQIKEDSLQLRDFERSVRNPLAHLIKPFDETELRRTTNFSSKVFLETLIRLARTAGVNYPAPFYFDQMNDRLKTMLTK